MRAPSGWTAVAATTGAGGAAAKRRSSARNAWTVVPGGICAFVPWIRYPSGLTRTIVATYGINPLFHWLFAPPDSRTGPFSVSTYNRLTSILPFLPR